MKANNILETIGNTPHVRLNHLFKHLDIEVWLKLERANPGNSIKDRIALAMIEDAEKKGLLIPGTTIVEPTSGNTGIGLAMVAAVKNYELILVMPESMSIERRRVMGSFGAKLVLTAKEKGMKGAIEKAQELAKGLEKAWMPMQFDNPANVETHFQNTAREISDDFDHLDYLITGVGTGGHITGCAGFLKPKMPGLKVLAVEPEASPVLGGGSPGPHAIQGIGAGFIPSILDMSLIDGVIAVAADDAFSFAERCAKEEGIFVGISTGASLAAIHKYAPQLPAKSKVLTFNYDTGERYLSVAGLFEAERN